MKNWKQGSDIIGVTNCSAYIVKNELVGWGTRMERMIVRRCQMMTAQIMRLAAKKVESKKTEEKYWQNRLVIKKTRGKEKKCLTIF